MKKFCVANWRWRIVFIRIAAQENFEELKRSCIWGGGKYWNITRTNGLFWRFENLLRSWLTEQLWQYLFPHQTLITSISMKPSCEIGMLRNTRDGLSIPGRVFDCWHARRDPDELYKCFKKFGDIFGYSENRRNWEKWERRTIAVNTFILFLGTSKTKSLNGGKRPKFMTNHAGGVGTCTQGMTIPSYLSSEMHLQKFPDQTKFQSWIVNFRAEVYPKARKKRKGAKFLHRAGDGRMFSVEDNWVFVQMETFCNYILHTHATWRRETVWKEVGDAKRYHLEQVSSSLPKVKEQTDEKAWRVQRPVPRQKLKIPCLWLTRWKRSTCNYRHHPVCRGYKSGNRCICGIRCLYRHADGEK